VGSKIGRRHVKALMRRIPGHATCGSEDRPIGAFVFDPYSFTMLKLFMIKVPRTIPLGGWRICLETINAFGERH
jgi:hypothetical protein